MLHLTLAIKREIDGGTDKWASVIMRRWERKECTSVSLFVCLSAHYQNISYSRVSNIRWPDILCFKIMSIQLGILRLKGNTAAFSSLSPSAISVCVSKFLCRKKVFPVSFYWQEFNSVMNEWMKVISLWTYQKSPGKTESVFKPKLRFAIRI